MERILITRDIINFYMWEINCHNTMYQIIHPEQIWNSFYWTDPIVIKQKVVGWTHNHCATVEPMGKSCQERQFCTGLQHRGRSLVSFLSQHFLVPWKLTNRQGDRFLVSLRLIFFPRPVPKVSVAFSSGVSPRAFLPDDALSSRSHVSFCCSVLHLVPPSATPAHLLHFIL